MLGVSKTSTTISNILRKQNEMTSHNNLQDPQPTKDILADPAAPNPHTPRPHKRPQITLEDTSLTDLHIRLLNYRPQKWVIQKALVRCKPHGLYLGSSHTCSKELEKCIKIINSDSIYHLNSHTVDQLLNTVSTEIAEISLPPNSLPQAAKELCKFLLTKPIKHLEKWCMSSKLINQT